MKEKATRDDAVRLDKWLWAARFYKTRALAREMIDGGKVHYNGQRGKPSKIVELNAELKLRQGNEERTVIVLALTSQCRGAPARRSKCIRKPKPASPTAKRWRWRAR